MVKKTRCTITRYMRTLRGAEKGTKDTYRSSANHVADKETSVEGVNPQIFRVGDIVEAQVSFIAVPLKDNKYKMIVVLRSIALLDASFSQVRMAIVTNHGTLICCSYSQTRHCRKH